MVSAERLETYLITLIGKKRTLLTIMLYNSQRITHGFNKVVKPVKQWFILSLKPAIGTLFLENLSKKRTLVTNVLRKVRFLLFCLF